MIVSVHAIERYLERVDHRLTFDQARAAILASSRAVEAAANFGARVVRLGSGAKLILDGATVVTVITPGHPLAGHRVGGL